MLKRFFIAKSFRLHISKQKKIPGNICFDISKVRKSSRRGLLGRQNCILSQKSVPQGPLGGSNCILSQKVVPQGPFGQTKAVQAQCRRALASRSQPFDITGGYPWGGTPRGGGSPQDHLNPRLGGQRGESRRHSHSLLTLVGSADLIIPKSVQIQANSKHRAKNDYGGEGTLGRAPHSARP